MSSPLQFIKSIKSSETILPCLNFSPIFDMINGGIVVGKDGISYLNGGISRNNAVVGGNNTQKTGMTVLAMSRTLIRFKHAIVLFFDIEATFDVPRLAKQIDREIGIEGYFNEKIMGKRFFYFNRNDGCDGGFVHDQFKGLAASIKEEIKSKNDIYLETPFLDSEKKPMKIIIPTIAVIDSISEMHFTKVSEHFQDGDVDEGGEKRTRDMAIGNLRRIVYEDADILGGQSGVFQFWTAQVADIINMTGRPLEKESVFIRQGKKIKGPKSLMRIPQTGHEIIRGSALKQGNEWMYPNPFGKDVVVDANARENPDLIMYTNSPYRNKSGLSGISLFFIGSQSLGIQEGLTMYHTLKTSGYYGLPGSNVSHACILYPDVKVGRTTIRKALVDDPKLVRAITIIYQLWFANTFWLEMDNRYRISPEELYEKIKEKGLDWDDILENTVDYWFDNPDIEKKTVTTMELVKVALGEREPYWVK